MPPAPPLPVEEVAAPPEPPLPPAPDQQTPGRRCRAAVDPWPHRVPPSPNQPATAVAAVPAGAAVAEDAALAAIAGHTLIAGISGPGVAVAEQDARVRVSAVPLPKKIRRIAPGCQAATAAAFAATVVLYKTVSDTVKSIGSTGAASSSTASVPGSAVSPVVSAAAAFSAVFDDEPNS